MNSNRFIHLKIKTMRWGTQQNTELAKIDFCIKDIIPKLDRMGKRKPLWFESSDNLKEYSSAL